MTDVIRGVVLRTQGAAISIEPLKLAAPRAGEVRIRMAASGICHSDLHIRDGDWVRPTPMVMGHEGAGFVEAIGPGVSALSPGQPVVLSWLIPCGSCIACAAGHPWACSASPSGRHALADGATSVTDSDGRTVRSYRAIGTMAESIVVPELAAVAIPDGIRPSVAALIGCCVSTGVGAVLRTAEVPAGATVAIIGLGGVGLSCVMGACLAGAARVIAIDRVIEKLAVAKDLGATETLSVNESVSDLAESLREITGGGPDFIFETVGGVATTQTAIDATPSGGTAVIVGIPAPSALATIQIDRLVEGGRRILGSKYGSSRPAVDFTRYARLHLAGRLPVERLIDREIRIDEVETAFDRLRAGEGLRSVAVFENAATATASPWT